MISRLVENIMNNAIKIKWKGEYVWVAIEIAEYLEYDKPSKIINYFISISNLIEGKDYLIISQDDLREFKDNLIEMDIYKFRQSPKLILFYESGLVDFLRYRNKVSTEDIKAIFGDVYEDVDLTIETKVDAKVFKNYEIYTLSWKGKPCWIAVDIAEVLGYSDRAKAVGQCIIVEKFKRGLDYEVLNSKEIKVILEQKGATPFCSRKRINRLTILYKKGLLGFINYSYMPIGREFRKWLRDEVFEEIIDIEVGETVSDNKFKIKRDNLSNTEVDNSKVIDSKFEMMKVLNIVDKILSEEDERKLFYLDTIFENI